MLFWFLSPGGVHVWRSLVAPSLGEINNMGNVTLIKGVKQQRSEGGRSGGARGVGRRFSYWASALSASGGASGWASSSTGVPDGKSFFPLAQEAHPLSPLHFSANTPAFQAPMPVVFLLYWRSYEIRKSGPPPSQRKNAYHRHYHT